MKLRNHFILYIDEHLANRWNTKVTCAVAAGRSLGSLDLDKYSVNIRIHGIDTHIYILLTP